jgi:hypothetical protein
MATPPRWITDHGPEHSQWYIDRFRTLAAEGADLDGEARLLVSRPSIAALPGRAILASLIVNFSVVPSHVPDPCGTTVGRLPRWSMASIVE